MSFSESFYGTPKEVAEKVKHFKDPSADYFGENNNVKRIHAEIVEKAKAIGLAELHALEFESASKYITVNIHGSISSFNEEITGISVGVGVNKCNEAEFQQLCPEYCQPTQFILVENESEEEEDLEEIED